MRRRVPAHAAEDVVQETYVAAWRSIGRLRDPGRVLAWLRRIARLQAAKYVLRAVRERTEPLEIDPEAVTVDPERVELLESLQKILKGIDPKVLEILVLRYVDELPLREIAQRVGVTVYVVRKTLEEVPPRVRRWLLG